MKLKLIFITCFFFLFNFTFSQDNLSVKIDERMEAISIFYILATKDTLKVEPTPSTYYKDVKKHFKGLQNHESLNWYRNLENWDGYDISSLGLFLTKKYPFKIMIEPEINYLKSSDINSFLKYFNKFYKDCDVKNFIKQHKKQYKAACIESKKKVHNSGVLNEIESFYGTRQDGKFIIYLDLLNNMGNNAIPSNSEYYRGQRMFRLAYLNDENKNLSDESPIVFEPYLNVVIHEISHLYVKDFLKNYKQELYRFRSLFLVTNDGKKLDETQWENELDELIVRVCTARIMQNKYGRAEGLKEIEKQSIHFKLAKPLYDLFDSYSLNRDKYKNIAMFYPVIMEYIMKYK